MNIVMLGIQGSGKGTLIDNLKEKFDFSLISMGQLFRDEISSGSALGVKLKSIIDKGELVGIDIVMDTIRTNLKRNKKQMTIFDGFPRNMAQADELDKICKIDKVFYLRLDKEEAINRILGRLTCKKCGYVTNKKYVKNLICPNCGGELVVRSDDTVEGINKRFEVYETETFPLIDRYKKAGILVEIDASQSPEHTLKEVLKVL